MEQRTLIITFAALVVVGLVFGLLAVAAGVPVPTGTAVGNGQTVMKVPIPPKLTDGSSLTSGTVNTSPSTGTTASPGATGSGATTSSDEPIDKPAMDQPARVGEQLVVIDNPPPNTVALLDSDQATPGSKYAVTFAPYGVGPSDGENAQLIIKILGSTPQGGSAKSYQFAGTNVLVSVNPAENGVVSVGGQYQGTLELVDQHGVLVPQLSGISVIRIRK